MKPTTQSSIEEYRQQLNRCVRAMAVARNTDVANFLPAGDSVDLVDLFTDGNIDKRFDKLVEQLETLGSSLDGVKDHIEIYIRSIPLEAYATGVRDADRFLTWLEERVQFTPEQQDVVTCERARFQVEFLAARMRSQHLRFQDLLSVADALREEFGPDGAVRIELNPIHQMARFHTPLLFGDDDDLRLPVNAVFFPIGTDIRTAVLEDAGLWLVQSLSVAGPRTLPELGRRFLGSVEELTDTCGDLVDVGMAAFS